MTTQIHPTAETNPRSWQRMLYGHLALARISNSPTVMSNVLAGAALAGIILPDGRVVALALSMVLFYTAGMYLNDLCDYALDCRERPERPLPAGLVSRGAALAVMLALFAAGIALLWPFGLAALLSGAVLVGLIVAYDLWHKTNPVSPLLMAGCRLMVYVTTFFAFASTPTLGLVIGAILLALYIVGLTAIAKSESRPSLVGYWPALLLFLPAAVFVAQTAVLWMLPLAMMAAGWFAYSCSLVYRSEERNIGGAIARLIAGISLCDALVLASMGSVSGVILAFACFALTLVLQRYVRGT